MLLRDGHQVLVAGRSGDAARRFCAAHGGATVKLDRDRDLDRIAALAPDAVVDAAGPFQSYGDDPYRWETSKHQIHVAAKPRRSSG